MMGHQRDILATMGIDIWIPRTVARVQHSQPSGLWRDQAQPEIITELALSQVEPPVSGESDIPEIDNALTQFVEIEQENVIYLAVNPVTNCVRLVRYECGINSKMSHSSYYVFPVCIPDIKVRLFSK